MTGGPALDRVAVVARAAGLAEPGPEAALSATRRRPWRCRMLAAVLRGALVLHDRTVRVLSSLPARPLRTDGLDVLLTGTFHSENWIRAHLVPLASSARCRRIRVVTASPVPRVPKVERVEPPRWLTSVAGAVPARLMVFSALAIRSRPDIVGGFHLLLNGLVAALVARLVRARSMYFCVGGPAEVLDGGLWSENRLFTRLESPDPGIERLLVRAVSRFDLVIAMGTRAVEFFRGRGVETSFHVVSGGIGDELCGQGSASPSFDLILVGRLAAVKRIDRFLEAVRAVRTAVPGVRAAIVGDGALGDELRGIASRLGVEAHVTFAGHQSDVTDWLRRAKVFVLTSDTEGLALSLMEAMMCGLPAVVSDVGDLGDLVVDEVNGYLVASRTPEAFAERIIALLTDPPRLAAMGRAARLSALRYTVPATVRQWDRILSAMS